MIVKGYKYLTEEAAQSGVDSLNTYYNIPTNVECLTINWRYYSYVESNNFWFIVWADSLNVVLGEPEDIELPDPPSQR